MSKFFTTLFSVVIFTSCGVKTPTVDVLIIGGGASGTMAGIQASRSGASALIAEPTTWIGGMLTAAGVTAFDGNYDLRSGLFGEFCDSLEANYGGRDALLTGWVSDILFEPSVGHRILRNMVAKSENLNVLYQTNLVSATRQGGIWKVVLDVNGVQETYDAKVLIDGTELGDVAALLGVKYDIGMESREVSGEDIAPEKSNDIIQDLTYVAVLKDYGKGVDKTIAKPEGYDKNHFACCCAGPNCVHPKEKQRVWDCESMITYGKLPNNKYMINWPIEGNDYYLNVIDMTPEQRVEALKKAKNFTMQFIYYIQTELGYKNLALADDEYPTDDLLPLMPYHRESRRIHGLTRFNVNHAAKPYDQPQPLYRTGIAVGDYPVDHHHTRYPNWRELPDLHFYPIPSYNLPLGALIPQDVQGLLVAEKSISVSNLVNGTTRLQPVVLQIGQAAGALAALAVKQNIDVADVSVRDVQDMLLAGGAYIMPYADIAKNDKHFAAAQRIGATGILRGIGLNVGWINVTQFRPDSLTNSVELTSGLKSYFPEFDYNCKSENVTVGEATEIFKAIGITANIEAMWGELGLKNFDAARTITRKEVAIIIDRYIDPYHNFPIDIQGNIKK